MKFSILALCVCIGYVAAFTAKPRLPSSLPTSTNKPYVKTAYSSDAEAPILRSESNINPDGFKYAFETGNGISAEATGHMEKVNDADAMFVEGQYQYPGGPNGELVQVAYVADANGYQPKGDILPTPPQMPDSVVRLLEYLSQHSTSSPH